MADTLILNIGVVPIVVVCQSGGKGAPIEIGDTSRAFAGNERTSIRAEKRMWEVVTSYITTAQEAAIQTLIARAAQIPCGGELLNNTTVTCSVRCARSTMVGGTTLWEMQLVVREV